MILDAKIKAIKEAEAIIGDQVVLIDLLEEENKELNAHIRSLEVQYNIVLRDYKTADILPFSLKP